MDYGLKPKKLNFLSSPYRRGLENGLSFPLQPSRGSDNGDREMRSYLQNSEPPPLRVGQGDSAFESYS